MSILKRENFLETNWDVVFIYALREELSATDIFLNEPTIRVDNDLNLEIHKRNISDSNGRDLKALTVLIDDQGLNKAAIVTTQLLQKIIPKLLILIGISGRINQDCMLGDVVLATSCDDSYYRAKLKDKTVIPGGKEWSLEVLTSKLNKLINENPPFYSFSGLEHEQIAYLQNEQLIGLKPKTHLGPVCSTQFVIDDQTFSQWVKNSRNRNLLVADMESASVVQAAFSNGLQNGNVLVIRGVSDFADGRKVEFDNIGSGLLRKIAIRNAAQLASHCVSSLLSFSPEGIISVDNFKANHAGAENHSAYSDTINLLKDIANIVDGGGMEEEAIIKVSKQKELNPIISSQLVQLAEEAYSQEIESNARVGQKILHLLPRTAIDYLIAMWIMDALLQKKIDLRIVEILSKVYPHRINRFCKVILNRLTDEKKLVDILIQAYNSKFSRTSKSNSESKERAKVHICYLLGRLRDPQQRKRAAEVLGSWRENLSGKTQTQQNLKASTYRIDKAFSAIEFAEGRLLLRTICISLILLNSPNESENYIRACLRNKEFDSLNRGFHLEYYGDIKYDPRESMNNIDPVNDNWSKTFDVLLNKLQNSYFRNSPYPLRDVELQTLLSLAQQRFASNSLDEEKRIKLIDLFKNFAPNKLSQINLLRAYAKMLQDLLSKPQFKRVDLLRKLFELKKLPRSGWNHINDKHSRITPNPESVLSHTAGGLLLIQFCLPDRLSKDDRKVLGDKYSSSYSKDEIFKMFLCHDLAEAYTGDLMPHERNDETKAEEQRANSLIDIISTWPGFYHFHMYRDWSIFEDNRTINGRVAKEIDVLENLLQLTIEKKSPSVQISDYETWKEDLKSKISTPMGKRILNMILE